MESMRAPTVPSEMETISDMVPPVVETHTLKTIA